MTYRVCISATLVLLRLADRVYRLAQRHGDWAEDDRLSRDDTLRLFDYIAGTGPARARTTPPTSISPVPPTSTWGTGVTVTYRHGAGSS